MKEDKQDAMTEAVEKALAAAEAAADGAIEAQSAAREARTTLASGPTPKGDKRALVIAGVAAAWAAFALGAAGLVYLRSITDLREASEMQATAVGAIIEKAKALDESVATLQPDTLVRRAEMEKLLQDLKAAIGEKSGPAVTPQDLEKLRGDIVASIAEVALRPAAGAGAATEGAASKTECSELTMMLGETMRALDAVRKDLVQTPKANRPSEAAARAPSAPTKAPKAAARPKAQAQTVYSFP